MAKLMKSHESQNTFDWSSVMVLLSVYITSDGLTKYLQKQHKYVWQKTGFQIENKIEDQG